MRTLRWRIAAIAASVCVIAQPMSAHAAGPVAEARKLVRRVTSMKSLKELPPLFTNETAAGMGIMLGAMVVMTGAMAEAMAGAADSMADAMGQALGPASGGPAAEPGNDAVGDGIVGEETTPPAAPKPAPKPARKPAQDPKGAAQMARLKKLTAEIEQVFRKHGVPMEGPNKPLTQQERARVIRSGRALLADVVRVMEKLPDAAGGPDKGMLMTRKDIRADKLKYRQISSTRVQIIDPSSPKTRTEARLEGGAWRLHMTDAVRVLDGKGLQGALSP